MRRINHIWLLIAAFAVIGAASPAMAQGRLDLQECVDLALKNNLQVRQSNLTVEQNRNNLTQAKMNFGPDINANASQSYNFGRSIDPFTNQFTTEPVRSNNFSVSGNIVLFNGLANQHNLKRSKLDLAASQYDYETAKNNLTLNVISSYTNVLLSQEQLEVAEQQLEISSSQVERTRRLVEAGSLPESNLLELRSQMATDELNVINAENNLALAYLSLKQLMNLPADEPLQVVRPEFDDPETGYDASAAQVYEQAENTQPQILAADTRILSASKGVAVARSRYYPTLSFSASVFTRYSNRATDYRIGDPTLSPMVVFDQNGVPTQTFYTYRASTEVVPIEFWDQMDLNLNQGVSLNLSIPIFNRWTTRTQVANAQVSREIAELEAANTRLQLRQNIEQAYVDMLAAAKTYTSTQRQVGSLQETFRSSEQRFNVGLLNAVDYNIARANLNRATSDLLRAKYDYVFKTKILDFYQNKPLSF